MCPKCKHVGMKTPAGRASRLLRCPECKGTWLPQNEARLDAVSSLLSNESTIRPCEDTDGRACLCPHGHGILIRAKVEGDEPFYVDRCVRCAGIWLDKGEWNKLAQNHLLENMELLWDPAWRHHARERRKEALYRESLFNDLGLAGIEALQLLTMVLVEKSPRVRSATIAHLRESVEHAKAHRLHA